MNKFVIPKEYKLPNNYKIHQSTTDGFDWYFSTPLNSISSVYSVYNQEQFEKFLEAIINHYLEYDNIIELNENNNNYGKFL